MSPQNENSKGGILFKILTGVLAIAIVALIFWFMNTKNELEGLLLEKENMRVELQAELTNLIDQHNQVKVENETLSEYLIEKDSIIQANAKQIEEGLRYKWSYFNIKKQLAELQDVANGYVIKIDELKLENKNLITENTQIKGQYAAEQQKTSELTKIKDDLSGKVEVASVLKTYAVKAEGVRVKNSGKESVTDKTKRVNKIKVCFILGANTLRQPGAVDLYIRIARADDAILAQSQEDEFSFNYGGETLQYSIKTTVDYTKQAVDVCCYWDNTGVELVAGNYKVAIYEGNNVIGHAEFSLR
ncbi:MAG: hypothetical protein GY834_03780 [Bacteroidetes bacterium]|nr:hypothetical protein [Bacteroidota bacterium]